MVMAPDLSNTSRRVSSPCIGVCTLGPNSLCIGCLRTSEEIGNWMTYSDAERDRITTELPTRLEALFAL
jgi:predicted Fe-S protein YdhL (DUF1289 family)